MAEDPRCPKCGAALSPGAAEGLCPRCLIQAGFDSATLPRSAFYAPTGSQSPPIIDEPLSPQELAQLLPQFDILELLGRGGMGAVYKARQLNLDRIVALKVIRPNLSRDPGFTERFSREARALARLSHQSIVTVHDFGQIDALCYLVMEYVDGVNLRSLIRQGKLTSEEALCIIPEICDALQFAHDEGIVHRDIKPENILLDKRGRVKIADFGLAKLLGTAQENVTLTGTGQVMGTLGYMAPEQFHQPDTVDHRADIYSLGAVFYEMLTGQLPIGRFQPPSKKVHIDVRLDEVVLRSLESEPERRYQRAGDVKTDVDAIRSKAAPKFVAETHPVEGRALQPDVRGPAICLLVTAAMQTLALLLVLAYFGNRFGPNGVSWLKLWILLFPLTFGALMIFGSIQMFRLQSYGWALTASVLALIPLGPSCLFGLPVGIWALSVLGRHDVRAAFEEHRRKRALDRQSAGLVARTFAPMDAAAVRVRDDRSERLAMVSCFGGIAGGLAIALARPILDEIAILLAFIIFVLSQLTGFVLGILAHRAPMGKMVAVTSGLMLLLAFPLLWFLPARPIGRAVPQVRTTVAPPWKSVATPDSSNEQPDTRWGYEWGPDGPELTRLTAITLRYDQPAPINKVLQESHRQYLEIEKKYSEQSTADGHQITTIKPIAAELPKLENDLWTKLDPLLDPQQQNIFRLNLRLVPQEVFRTSPTMHDMVSPGLFGWGKQSARIEIWREGTWYRWVVSTNHGTRPEEKSRAPQLPPEYRRFWKEELKRL